MKFKEINNILFYNEISKIENNRKQLIILYRNNFEILRFNKTLLENWNNKNRLIVIRRNLRKWNDKVKKLKQNPIKENKKEEEGKKIEENKKRKRTKKNRRKQNTRRKKNN